MGLRVAVLGATGVVGLRMLRALDASVLEVDELRPLASERSAGRRVAFAGEELEVRAVDAEALRGLDLVLASAGAEASRRWLPRAAAAGAVCVDNSSAFRMEPDVPLVVPEVNPRRALEAPRGIVANPNCSTIQLVVALKPLLDAAGLRRVHVSTYQGVSGAGRAAWEELVTGSRRHLDAVAGHTPALEPDLDRVPDERRTPDHLRALAFNAVPWIDRMVADGETREEWKLRVETAKILETDVPLHATCVRVPVFVGHSEAVWVETERPLDPGEARGILAAAPGVVVEDDREEGRFPVPLAVAGDDRVWVGRVRRDPSARNGLALWVVADNLRKGAATNAVDICGLLKDGRLSQ